MIAQFVIESLNNFDYKLFFHLNQLNSEYWDNFFWIFTSKEIWIPLYFAISLIICCSQKQNGIITIIFILLVILLCDQISTNVLKHGIERLRPSHIPEFNHFIHLVAKYRGGKYGFVSSHACNTFGLVIFTSLLFKNKTYTISMSLWAFTNAYSRIYLGVHFPGDIMGGLILGCIIGLTVYKLYLKITHRYIANLFNSSKTNTQISQIYYYNKPEFVVYTLFVTIISLLLVSKVLLRLL